MIEFVLIAFQHLACAKADASICLVNPVAISEPVDADTCGAAALTAKKDNPKGFTFLCVAPPNTELKEGPKKGLTT